mmetsp:Transcript_125505/g.360795  ORF Transcript_125505/g.360795 Transcript_125505/m.360795 type:complete len:126 (-) Transcript_125505:612-989(-)
MPGKGEGAAELADKPANESRNPLELPVQKGAGAGAVDRDATDASASPTTPGSIGAKSPLTPHHSCLSGNSFQRARTDSRGNLIQKGGKKHKATWADEVQEGASVAEVKGVTSLKKSTVTCGCSLM